MSKRDPVGDLSHLSDSQLMMLALANLLHIAIAKGGVAGNVSLVPEEIMKRLGFYAEVAIGPKK